MARKAEEAVEAQLFEHKERIDHVLSWWPELTSREEEATERHDASRKRLDELVHRAGQAERQAAELLAAQGELRTELLAKCATEAVGTERKLGGYLQQVREETALLVGRKADAVDVDERHAALDARLAAFAQQLQPIVSELGELHTSAQQLSSRVESRESREAKLLQKLQDAARGHEQLAAGLNDARSVARANQHGLAALMGSQQELEAQLRSLESAIGRVGGVSEEQGRYINQISDALHQQQLVPQKFRSHAMLLPAFASAAPAPTGSYYGSVAGTARDLRTPSNVLSGRPHAGEIAAVPGDSPGSLVP